MMTVEVRQGDINWDSLSKAQEAAAAGEYATTMGGFIMWLANDLEFARDVFRSKRLVFREDVQAEHKRTADVIAQLAAAWNLFLFFAIDIGAIDEAMAERIEADMWAGLTEVAGEQSELQRAAEPVGRFRDLIVAALGTGRAHLQSVETGGYPANAEQWGWQRDGFEWRARGECIGWLSAVGQLYLEPNISYAVASRIGSIGISVEALSARMADKGVTVVEHEGKRRRRRHRVKREVKGKRHRVLHVRTLEWLYPSDSGASGANGADAEKHEAPHEVGDARL